MGENTNQIEREIADERQRLGHHLTELGSQVHQLTDWRTHYRRNPMLSLGTALGGGILLGALAGWRSPRDEKTRRATLPLRTAWRSIAQALLTVASAQTNEFATRLAPRRDGPRHDRVPAPGRGQPTPAVAPAVPARAIAASSTASTSVFVTGFRLIKQTGEEWIDDKAPQLGAALAYYTVFSLAPLVLLIVAIVGLLFRDDPSGVWTKITQQMSYVLDKSAVDVIQGIAREAAQPGKGVLATMIGVGLALFGATGMFIQLQDSLNTIWGIKAKPGLGLWGFLRARFVSFGMVGGVCFLLLVSLVIESLLKGFSHWVQAMLPGGLAVAVTVYLVFDFLVVVLLFAMIFKYLPDAKIWWRDVWAGSVLTACLFLAGKWALGLYLGSGVAASAYGAASSLITLLLWIYYSSQILLFGAEFTQVYANYAGANIRPNKYGVAI